ncbi:unnamed protein product [Anisakis simplex]|uniref:Fanconi-associated nuclease n=1 Tax=Anisakis simplex TaxID=6269 RepID=A0A0M3K616_ANISI|nr:unnamed protein product [Anisakis simplex]
MALLRSFNRQRGLRKCPICSVMVKAGKYSTHINECLMNSDDDDCVVVETITAEEKRRRAAEQIICLDQSGEESAIGNSVASTSVKSTATEEMLLESSDSNNNISNETAAVTRKSDRIVDTNGTGNKSRCENQRRTRSRNETNEKRPVDSNDSGQSSVSNNIQGFEEVENRIRGIGTGRTSEMMVQEECNVLERTTHNRSVTENLNAGEQRNEEVEESFGRIDSSTSIPTRKGKQATLNNKKRSIKMNLNYKVKKVKRTSEVEPNDRSEEVRSQISLSMKNTIKMEIKTEPRICETEREIKKSEISLTRKSSPRVVARPPTVNSSPRMTRSKHGAEEELISLAEVARRIRRSLRNCETELSATAVPESALKSLADDCNGNDDNNDADETTTVTDNATETSTSDGDDQQSNALPPYYLVLFMRVLKRVLYDQCDERSHYSPLFWGENLRMAEKFLSLSGEAKCLFVRLFTRKRRWVLADHLNYGSIATDLLPLFKELDSAGLIESCRSGLNDLSEAIKLLHAPSLKVIGNKFHVNVKVGKLNIIHSYALLQLSLNKIRYPAPLSSPIIPIYTDQEMLFSYMIAKELEAELAEAMGRSKWEDVESGAQKAAECLSKITPEYRRVISVLIIRCEALPPYLRRYTDIWVYTRCMSFGTEALQRQRKYKEAVAWLKRLLYSEDMKNFVMDARGGWWDRLALNLDSHLNRKSEAFQAIRAGLEDACVGDKDRLLLQDRGEKIDANWKGPLNVPDPERVDISGSTLSKNLGDSRSNRFIITSTDTHYECSVEGVALNHYLKNGFKEGVHAEGSVWHTVYGLLCYDIIFDDHVKNVWFSETQVNF